VSLERLGECESFRVTYLACGTCTLECERHQHLSNDMMIREECGSLKRDDRVCRRHYRSTMENPPEDDPATGCDLTRHASYRSFISTTFYRFLAFLDEVRFRTSVIFGSSEIRNRGEGGERAEPEAFLASGRDSRAALMRSPRRKKGVTRVITASLSGADVHHVIDHLSSGGRPTPKDKGYSSFPFDVSLPSSLLTRSQSTK
jgi:hypothetical protein